MIEPVEAAGEDEDGAKLVVGAVDAVCAVDADDGGFNKVPLDE